MISKGDTVQHGVLVAEFDTGMTECRLRVQVTYPTTYQKRP